MAQKVLPAIGLAGLGVPGEEVTALVALLVRDPLVTTELTEVVRVAVDSVVLGVLDGAALPGRHWEYPGKTSALML